MTFCPQCRSSNDRGQVFCGTCGNIFPEQVPVTSPSLPSLPVNPRKAPPLRPVVPFVQSLPRPKTVILSPVLVLGLISIILMIAATAFSACTVSPLSAGINNSTGSSHSSGTLPVNGQCSAGLSPCSGRCVDLQTDPDNCGACGFSVPYGETCRNGQFSSSSGLNKNGSSAASPGATSAGSVLTSATVAGIKGSCPTGRSSCSGTCTDLLNDTGNCGSCGNSCLSGQTCQNGRCLVPGTSVPVVSTSALITITPELSCSYGQIPCGNSCVNIFTDKKNCGVCGRTCGSQETCVNARCGPACTESGTSLCDDTCVDLDTDMKNCGSCGTECPSRVSNARGSSCMQGECIIEQCKTDFADCNKKTVDGCEVFLRTDAGNCGTCGTKCPSGQVCYNKKCSDPIGT